MAHYIFFFSSKSRFSVHPENRRIFIWRERGSGNNLAILQENVRFGSEGVMVYADISTHERMSPHHSEWSPDPLSICLG